MKDTEVIVMFVGPNYGVRDEARIAKAIRLARRRGCPIVVCGDGNGGRDLAAYAEQCHRQGIDVIALGRGHSNTRKDALRAARAIETLRPSAKTVWLVTHWYHLPRAWIALQQRLLLLRPDVRILAAPVFRDFADGLRRLPGEARGCYDYLANRQQRRFGRPLGKPDEEASSVAEKPPPRRWRSPLSFIGRLAR